MTDSVAVAETVYHKPKSAIFKIHRSLLARYSTAIGGMLTAPTGEGHNDGGNPALMTEDGAASWELLPGLQYNIPRNKSEALRQADLLTILPVVHKHCMDEIETWDIEKLKATSSYDGFVDLIVASRIVGSNELYNILHLQRKQQPDWWPCAVLPRMRPKVEAIVIYSIYI
ncbi:hypothetical protein FRC20_011192 [Serendipita sp. 405]|nr:hypothetical protein FRC15_001886 [Serendipita sp. 397]KAG8870903.1 hypothetical protein FRC20_011192 [Serendipita sp. 405]